MVIGKYAEYGIEVDVFSLLVAPTLGNEKTGSNKPIVFSNTSKDHKRSRFVFRDIFVLKDTSASIFIWLYRPTINYTEIFQYIQLIQAVLRILHPAEYSV